MFYNPTHDSSHQTNHHPLRRRHPQPVLDHFCETNPFFTVVHRPHAPLCEASRRSWAGLRSVPPQLGGAAQRLERHLHLRRRCRRAKGCNPGTPSPCRLTGYPTLQQPRHAYTHLGTSMAKRSRGHMRLAERGGVRHLVGRQRPLQEQGPNRQRAIRYRQTDRLVL
jgi:hypothetical protein